MTNILNPIAAMLLVGATTLSFTAPASAQVRGAATTPRPVQFSGTDRNWFNSANWSSGRVPGSGDSVMLDSGDDVVIDPALAGGVQVAVGDLNLAGTARLETLPGTVVQTSGTTTLAKSAQLIMRSSASLGGNLAIAPPTQQDGCDSRGCWVWLNPTPQSKIIIVLQSTSTMVMGLGGRTPASVTRDASGRISLANGYGHYATLTASESMSIAGNLWLNLHYGFKPARGDRFQIATAQQRASGSFTGLPEGALAACTDDGVGLSITYRGGNGNDVELIAADASREACDAPTVQPLFQVGGRIALDDPGIAQTREHILLARQVNVP